MTRVIALPRALPGKTCAVTIARETRWDSPSEVLNQHSAPGQKRSSEHPLAFHSLATFKAPCSLPCATWVPTTAVWY